MSSTSDNYLSKENLLIIIIVLIVIVCCLSQILDYIFFNDVENKKNNQINQLNKKINEHFTNEKEDDIPYNEMKYY
jgi:flagellar basal body-associated protein FliL